MDMLAFIAAAVAFELWLVTVIVGSFKEGRHDAEKEHTSTENRTSIPEAAKPRQAATLTNNGGGETPEEKHRRHEKQYWVLGLVIAAIATFAATAAGIAAFFAYQETARQAAAAWETVGLTREQVKEARRQADTAVDAEHQQLRAYLGPVHDSFWMSCLSCDPQIPGKIGHEFEIAATPDSLDYSLKNYGPTPAKGPAICIHLDAVGTGESADNKANNFLAGCLRPYRLPWSSSLTRVPTMWPGDERKQQVSGGDFIEAANRIARQRADAYVFGVIIYWDIFNTQHHTFICRTTANAQGGGKVWAFHGCSVPDQWQDD